MIKKELKQLEKQLDDLIELAESSMDSDFNFESFEVAVYQLEEKTLDNRDEAIDEGLYREVDNLLNGISELKKENNFFDAEDELDRMFPNRNDEDFDDEDMSYDNVFGSD